MQTGMIKIQVRSFYDVQKLRIEMSNRVCAQVTEAYCGTPPQGFGTKGRSAEEKKHDQSYRSIVKDYNKYLNEWGFRHGHTAKDAATKALLFAQHHAAVHLGVITVSWAAVLMDRFVQMKKLENNFAKDIDSVIEQHPMYAWLMDKRGIGVAMAGVILSEFDITRAPTVSNFWSYAGLHVKEGRAPKRKAGEKANWNQFLRAKLVGVLGTSFLRSGSEYRKVYDDTVNRLQCKGKCSLPLEEHAKSGSSMATFWPSEKQGKPQPGDYCTKGHIHNQAIRKMVKMFLIDLHTEWRTREGLPVRPPYHEEKLGMVHSG